jgi:predicted enzyme related to lactoylglutathione lyase
LGFRYLTFDITNLDVVCRHLEAQNMEFTRKKTQIRPGLTIAMVKDPDGNIVEFVERS